MDAEAGVTAPNSADQLRGLIVSASFGSGHHQANDAVDQALQARGLALNIRHADLLKYLSGFERTALAGTYDFWLKHTPAIYRAFYNWTDGDRVPTAQTFGWLGLQEMTRDVREVRPEFVLSSYPTPVALANNVRRHTGLDFLNALVVTDYRIHHHWARPEAELLMVATPEAKEQMNRWHIPPEQVVVTGIPISGKYKALIGADKAALRERYGLRPDLPLLLISGGGTGSYRASQRVLGELGNLGRRVQVLVLAGTKEIGVEQVGGATLHRLGYTTEFPELLAASDLVVGKAGGLTVAEATTLGVPMIIHEPIPGQEEHNAEYLVRHGAALWAKSLSDLRPAVLRALDPELHAELSQNAMRISSPDAAKLVATTLLEKLGR